MTSPKPRTTGRKFPPKSDVWLVWSLQKDGNMLLRSIDTKKWVAERHKMALESEIRSGYGNSTHVHIEKGQVNHMYACGFQSSVYGARAFIRGKWLETQEGS